MWLCVFARLRAHNSTACTAYMSISWLWGWLMCISEAWSTTVPSILMLLINSAGKKKKECQRHHRTKLTSHTSCEIIHCPFKNPLPLVQIPLSSRHIHSRPLTVTVIKTISPLKIRLCWRIQCLPLSSTSVSTAQDGRPSCWPTSSTMDLPRTVRPACRRTTGETLTTPLHKSWSFYPTSLA